MTILRVRVAAPEVVDGTLAVRGAEHRYLARVRRARPGEAVEVLDGAGGRWRGTIASVDRTAALLAGLVALPPARHAPLTLGLGAGRAEPLARVVRAAAEFGVARLVPLRAARGLPRNAREAAALVARWRRIAGDALRSSGVARAPAVSGLCRLDEWATGLSGEDARVVLDADGDPIADVVRGRAAACPAAWALAVGPEGGWSPDEIAGLAARGFVRASLGPSNLRVDTAAIGALAVVRALAG